MGEMNVVLGAGGGAGSAVVRQLVAQSKPVRAVNRSGEGRWPDSVESVRADVSDPAAARVACAGAAVVYHCVNVPYPKWTPVLPGVMDSVIAAAESADATLVYCDNLYAYGPADAPLTERSPLRAEGAKGRLRNQLADRLLGAHAGGHVRAVIGRGSDFFGPGATNTVAGQLVFPKVVEDEKARWLGSLDQPHSQNYVDDFARGLIVLGESPRALGEVWHIPPNGSPTGREFIEMAFAAAGREARIGVYPRWMMRFAALLSRDMREILEVLHQFENPFVLDGSKFTDTFGDLELTPMREAVARTVEWFREESGS
ncbi:MAG: NAD-dependent epimerase/dehydratase family protein [Longimicrobiales bacterium]|nr:NAD-dependent epimerase/dehydratase family protein [Longimicrobiales bacterium]